MRIRITRCDGRPDATYTGARAAWRAIHHEYPKAALYCEGDDEITSLEQLTRALSSKWGGRILVWATRADMDGPAGQGDDGSNAYAEVLLDTD